MTRIDKDIFRLLMEKRGINRSRAYELVEEKKKQHNYAISRDTAAYLVAAETGIDISRYLEESELAKVREAGGTAQPSLVLTVPKRPTARAKELDLGVTISADVKIVDPYLPRSMLEEARRMAAVYPVVYVFENSVRSLIMSVMSRRYGDKWFGTKVSG